MWVTFWQRARHTVAPMHAGPLRCGHQWGGDGWGNGGAGETFQLHLDVLRRREKWRSRQQSWYTCSSYSKETTGCGDVAFKNLIEKHCTKLGVAYRNEPQFPSGCWVQTASRWDFLCGTLRWICSTIYDGLRRSRRNVAISFFTNMPVSFTLRAGAWYTLLTYFFPENCAIK